MNDTSFEWYQVLKNLISTISDYSNVDRDSRLRELLRTLDSNDTEILDCKLMHVVDVFQKIEELSYEDAKEKSMSGSFKAKVDPKKLGKVLGSRVDPRVQRLVLKYLKLFVVRYLNNSRLAVSVAGERIGKVLRRDDVPLLALDFLEDNQLVDTEEKKIYHQARDFLVGIRLDCRCIYDLIKELEKHWKDS